MYELSLFTGAGGGLLASHLLGWTPVGYVEFNDYCQRVIAARIRDGYLPEAPIFGDVRAFIRDGYADGYQGLVDVVTAGFPCQPFSVAGKMQGDADERNMWPATIDVIRRVRPRFALLENVPGLLAHEYARRIFGDLADSGLDCIWRRLSAAEAGAPHLRDRWLCVAYANSQGLQKRPLDAGMVGTANGRNEREAPAVCSWWDAEPEVGRVADRMAHRVDRIRAIGNGQVPAVVRGAWHLLTEDSLLHRIR